MLRFADYHLTQLSVRMVRLTVQEIRYTIQMTRLKIEKVRLTIQIGQIGYLDGWLPGDKIDYQMKQLHDRVIRLAIQI